MPGTAQPKRRHARGYATPSRGAATKNPIGRGIEPIDKDSQHGWRPASLRFLTATSEALEQLARRVDSDDIILAAAGQFGLDRTAENPPQQPAISGNCSQIGRN